MVFIAESITSSYDKEQDRLSFTFQSKDQKLLTGLMTRQFLKGLLAQLPGWLAPQQKDAIPQTAEQQRIINQIYHQASQQKATVTYGKALPDQPGETFLIYILNFTKTKGNSGGENQKIKLEFLDQNKVIEVSAVLSTAQLHKFIAEILKQVQTWDLQNPWQDKSRLVVSGETKDSVMH